LFEGFGNSTQRMKFVVMGDDLLQAAQQVAGLAPALQRDRPTILRLDVIGRSQRFFGQGAIS
jgi:hypothetical protein